MAYLRNNKGEDFEPRSAKDLEERVKNGEEFFTYNPSKLFKTIQNGTDVIEYPYFPKPHTKYTRVKVKDGKVIAVLKK